ncbi:MAG: alpha-hydroxy-acid oxidizing protein, partial [Ruminococcus sp.]|nr:alpha-hydroxy-acid oxidizing protein [Ruminococcus sp.]
MSTDEEMEQIYAAGADTIEIIKPFADESLIFHRIEFALSHGAFGVGMDIDHAFGRNGAYDMVGEYMMEPKTVKQLESYVKAAGDLPFVVKGVLSVIDAQKCVAAGAKAITVSHHHGFIDGAVP